MQPHEQRVVNEKAELEEKMTKLRLFVTSDKITSLDPVDQDLLTEQLDAMGRYSRILGERIERFLANSK